MIKNAKNKKMTFENVILPGTDIVNMSSTSIGGLVLGPCKTKKGNQLSCDAYNGVMAPNATMSIRIIA